MIITDGEIKDEYCEFESYADSGEIDVKKLIPLTPITTIKCKNPQCLKQIDARHIHFCSDFCAYATNGGSIIKDEKIKT